MKDSSKVAIRIAKDCLKIARAEEVIVAGHTKFPAAIDAVLDLLDSGELVEENGREKISTSAGVALISTSNAGVSITIETANSYWSHRGPNIGII